MEIIIHIQKKHSTNVQQHNTEINGNSEKNASPIKQILRTYEQPTEFSEFPWHILRQIFLPQDRKTIKKTAKSFSPLTADHSPRNKRFQLPLIPTANHILWHCSNSQSALRTNLAASSTSLWEFVSGPILAGAPKRIYILRIIKNYATLHIYTLR